MAEYTSPTTVNTTGVTVFVGKCSKFAVYTNADTATKAVSVTVSSLHEGTQTATVFVGGGHEFEISNVGDVTITAKVASGTESLYWHVNKR